MPVRSELPVAAPASEDVVDVGACEVEWVVDAGAFVLMTALELIVLVDTTVNSAEDVWADVCGPEPTFPGAMTDVDALFEVGLTWEGTTVEVEDGAAELLEEWTLHLRCTDRSERR